MVICFLRENEEQKIKSYVLFQETQVQQSYCWLSLCHLPLLFKKSNIKIVPHSVLIEGTTIITDFLKEKFMKRTKTPSEAAHIASLLYNFQTLESVENYSQGWLEDHERRLEYQRLSAAFLFPKPLP